MTLVSATCIYAIDTNSPVSMLIYTINGIVLSLILQVSFTQRNCIIVAVQIVTIANKLCTMDNKNPGKSFSLEKKSRFLVRENILPGQGDINK